MEKTKQMIDEFLGQVEKDKVLAAEKIKELKEQKMTLDGERSEISKALIRMENDGDKVAVGKLNAELTKRIDAIEILSNKIEAYMEMGHKYEAETQRIFAMAAKELNEEYPKSIKQASNRLEKARESLEKTRELVKKQENELSAAETNLSCIKNDMKYVVEDRLKEVEEYLPETIKMLVVPEVKGHYETVTENEVTKQVYVQDSENYGDGLEGKLNFYYKTVICKKDKTEIEEKKSFIDKILGR